MNRKIIAYSDKGSAEENLNSIVSEVKKEAYNIEPILMLFFSDHEGFPFYAKSLHEIFPNTITIGAATCSVYSSLGQSETGICAMAIMSGITCASGLILDTTRFPMKHAEAQRKVLEDFGEYENTVCFELVTGYPMCEELSLDTLRVAFEGYNIPLVGSSSGTELYEGDTYVALNGEIYTEACVYVLIHNLNGRILLYKENMYKPMDRFLTVTDVDCDSRAVYEFDNMPALEAYGKALGVDAETARKMILTHPLGRYEDNDIFITSVSGSYDDGSVTFYARLFNHSRMAVLEIDDLELVHSKTVHEIEKDNIRADFFIAINCGSRARMFRRLGKYEAFVKSLADDIGDYVGVSGFGEQLGYLHFNDTLILAIFE